MDIISYKKIRDFYNKHNRRGDVYRGKLRRLPPNAYNFIINKAFKRFNNE